MTLPVEWSAEAEAELVEALAYYDDIRYELGGRFAQAVRETIKQIAAVPLRFAMVDQEIRRAGVPKFPYGLFFLVEETRVIVVACFHGKRDPKHWQERES